MVLCLISLRSVKDRKVISFSDIINSLASRSIIDNFSDAERIRRSSRFLSD